MSGAGRRAYHGALSFSRSGCWLRAADLARPPTQHYHACSRTLYRTTCGQTVRIQKDSQESSGNCTASTLNGALGSTLTSVASSEATARAPTNLLSAPGERSRGGNLWGLGRVSMTDSRERKEFVLGTAGSLEHYLASLCVHSPPHIASLVESMPARNGSRGSARVERDSRRNCRESGTATRGRKEYRSSDTSCKVQGQPSRSSKHGRRRTCREN